MWMGLKRCFRERSPGARTRMSPSPRIASPGALRPKQSSSIFNVLSQTKDMGLAISVVNNDPHNTFMFSYLTRKKAITVLLHFLLGNSWINTGEQHKKGTDKYFSLNMFMFENATVTAGHIIVYYQLYFNKTIFVTNIQQTNRKLSYYCSNVITLINAMIGEFFVFQLLTPLTRFSLYHHTWWSIFHLYSRLRNR